MRLLLDFDGHEEEQALIGRMLMAYSEFEFDLAKFLGYALNGDHDTGVRLFFRVNGEGARLEAADALLRPFFDGRVGPGKWGNALGTLRYCKDVRNQYAHCTWHRAEGEPLRFMNVKRDAASAEGELLVTQIPTDLGVIQKQHQYFEYALDWLFFLDCWHLRSLGEAVPVPPVPKSIPQPPLNSLQKKGPPTPEGQTTP